ncbi:Type IIS restriction enzyme Eco57I [Phycisphaerae bacterium RAS1]|nr:Type IIS restriction enzyme Eco57I [Phycisphaerae bacterium RAS1]
MGTAPTSVLDLVEKFRTNSEHYRSSAYNETLCRIDFINPLFAALGWDVANAGGYADAYRDVIHEDSLRVGEGLKAPDYSFRIGGTRKFFVEAKKPGVNLKSDPVPAYQLRRYAWSAKLPLSVLTDFEEFAVYDCRQKPSQNDKPSVGRLIYCTFEEYAEKWGDIAAVFSRDAVLKGAFDRFAESARGKRGTTEVDRAFLAEIEGWRDALARNVALRNPEISQRDLNFAVQRIIDRIIFLRIAEDRGMEPYSQLASLLNGERVYERLGVFFRAADQRYNSGIFHFERERDRSEPPDELTPTLSVDDKVLKDIVRNLYYPDSPYAFGVLPADILGQVYEQFLGKVIRLTTGHRAVVEEKPEVRKAGGVYYTPTYIVDYIVRHTVGRLLGVLEQSAGTDGAGAVLAPDAITPKDAAKLRILDPACGSGSFLIAAYQFLLDWHLKWYSEHDPEKLARGKSPPIYQATRGRESAGADATNGSGWRLTTSERKRILLNSIFGVDIDPQAVEVTKLSLLLKVLEGESGETLTNQWRLLHERALPDLGDNIKCGNSLIGPDFYENQQLLLLDDEARYKINVFDWNDEFRTIIRSGGFDAIVANPPYGASFSRAEEQYLRSRYRTPANSLDSFLLFVERAGQLLRNDGQFGMIIPSGWTSLPSAMPLRMLFVEQFRPTSFVSLPFDVFAAYVDCVIVTAQKWDRAEASTAIDLYVFPARHKIATVEEFECFHKSSDLGLWRTSPRFEFLVTCSTDETRLINKLRTTGFVLGDELSVKRGIETFQPVRFKKGLTNPQTAFAGVLQRYILEPGQRLFISFPPDIQRSKPVEYFSSNRILLRQVLSRSLRLQATYTEEFMLTSQSVQSLIPSASSRGVLSLLQILAILNSKLLSWFFVRLNAAARRDDFPKIILEQTRELPLPHQSATSKAHAPNLARLDRLVNSMLALNQSLSQTRIDHEATAAARQITAVDRQIDRIVYELFDLTESEIDLVEDTALRL